MKYCGECGAAVALKVPPGDHLPRHVCDACGTIHYRNPRVIVGCIPVWEGRILMCRRAIQPRHGLWTFPAGFLEIGETAAEGARRETLEESGADVEIDAEKPLALIDVPYVAQVYLIYRGRMTSAEHHPTPESSETVLMTPEELPWEQIAFPTILHSLKFWLADRESGRRETHTLALTARPRAPEQREVSTGAPP